MTSPWAVTQSKKSHAVREKRRPPLGGSGGRLPVRLGGEEPVLVARLSPASQVCTHQHADATARTVNECRFQLLEQKSTGSVAIYRAQLLIPSRSSGPNNAPNAVSEGIYPDRVRNPRPQVAAFFDLDKTVIARSSTLAFSRPLHAGGLINRRAVLRSTYAHFVYLAGGADHDQMERMRAYLSSLVRGWDVQQVRDIVDETLLEIIQPVVYREAVSLIAEHHAAGHDVVIVSTSGVELVDPIAGLLGADAVIATRMAVEDGRYTGDIDFYAYRENKAAAIL